MFVKNTQRTWDLIEHRINTMFSDREKYALRWDVHTMPQQELHAILYQHLFPSDKYQLIEQLGEKYFATTDRLKLHLCATFDKSTYDVYTFDMVEHRFVPHPWTSAWWEGEYSYISTPAVNELVLARRNAIRLVGEEKKSLIEKTKQAFFAAPSVNALVKAWPAITEFLPQEIIDKLNKKVEREKFSVEDLGDLNSVNAAILRAKVAA